MNESGTALKGCSVAVFVLCTHTVYICTRVGCIFVYPLNCIKIGTAIDPCCGSGGMFVQSAKFIENHSGNLNQISVFGQDSNPTTWKMAQMNLAIRGIEANLGSYNADTFFNDCHPTLRADYIMAIIWIESQYVFYVLIDYLAFDRLIVKNHEYI